MCGLCGFYHLDRRPADPGVIVRMADSIRHRGPDDQGFRRFSLESGQSTELKRNAPPQASTLNGAVGFNRLSILDLSEHGHQPMCSRDGRVFIVYNGEVYNAFDFTAELKAAGFQFRGRSDTEVILYLYEHYGIEGVLERLNGMFAIVIVDLRMGELHIARDHLGVKPLYWSLLESQGRRTFLFASEVKAFLSHPEFRAELAEDNLDEYLTFRYCAEKRFLLKGVQQLPPGHRLRLTSSGIAVTRYWRIPDEPTADLDAAQALDRLDGLLRESVRSQLLSDVKVGCQLSGGIDSSLVCVFARSHFDADMDTFSVVFDDPIYSEERWIEQAVRRAQVESHRFLFTERTFFDNLDRATWHLDQPLNHPNSLGIDLLAKHSRDLVTVLLSGEGADELFGGYLRYYYAAIRPRALPWLGLLGRLPKIGRKFTSIFGHRSMSAADVFIMASAFQQPADLLKARPTADTARVLEQRRAIFDEGDSHPPHDHISRCTKYDLRTYLVDLLVRQDKMTMAHSLENRVPFLDRRMVDFVRSLPSRFLVGSSLRLRESRMRNTKIILKRLAERVFDSQFVYRPKSGFSLPLSHYYAQPEFRELMEDRILPGLKSRGIVRHEVIAEWWRGVSGASQRVSETLWIYVAFELWAQRFLDQRPAMPDARGVHTTSGSVTGGVDVEHN